MRIIKYASLEDFDFWAGAKSLAEKLTPEELDTIEEYIESYIDPISEVELNDLFWFGCDEIASILGYDDEEDMWDDLLKREVTAR